MSLRPRPSLVPSILALGLAAGASILAGCTTAPTEEFDLAGLTKSDGGSRCTPGETQDCICLGGGQGIQTCRASGSSFGSCTGCAMGTDGPVSIVTDMGGSACGNCDGCCDGTTCVPFANETNPRCGTRGQACAACAGAKICSTTTGTCVDAGGGCMNCTYGVTCESGSCTTNLDPNAYFKVIVKSLKLTPKDPDGNKWDGIFDADPEPQACFYYQVGGTIYKGCSDYVSAVDNTTSYDGTFDATTGLVTAGGSPFLIPASAWIAGTVHVVGQDNDSGVNLSGDDIAADFPFMITTLKTSYSTGMHGNVIDMVFELH